MRDNESREMYLETIYLLSRKESHVRSVDIANAMSFSRPSVSRGVSLLEKNGDLVMDEEGYLTLTAKGEAEAAKVYGRHQGLTRFLGSLGVSAKTAEDDACRIEHILSEETMAAIRKRVPRK